MMNSISKTIILLLSVILYTGCAVKNATYSIEEVERHKYNYRNKQNAKSLDILIRIYQDSNQTDEARLLALNALSDISHPKVINAIQTSVSSTNLINLDLMIKKSQIVLIFINMKMKLEYYQRDIKINQMIFLME